MSEPKKQHYVPQLYLRNFSSEINTEKIYVKSNRTSKIYLANISDTAAQRNFYTVNKYEDKYIWEKHFASKIEPMLSTITKTIRSKAENALIQNGTCILSGEEKEKLALSIMFQFLRGTNTRSYEKKLYNDNLPIAFAKAKERFSPLNDEQIEKLKQFENNDDYFKDIAISTIFNEKSLVKYINHLLTKSFLIYRIIGDELFITSDNPVVLLNSITLEATPFKNGLENESTVVLYPISPKTLVVAYHPAKFFGALKRMDCCISFIESKKEKSFIHTANKAQKHSCDNYLYSNSKEYLSKV